MNYDLTPVITRLTPFSGGGGALASVDVNFGPIMIRARLCNSQKGLFLSWPQRKGENIDKYFDQVAIADPSLKMKAQKMVIEQYQTLSEGELVHV